MRIALFAGAVALATFAVSLTTLFWFAAPAQTSASAAVRAELEAALQGEMCTASRPQETAHEHPMRPVAAGAAVPTVTHLVFPDAIDGYNIQILTENFTFTPAAINREAAQNKGHAHLYVNGRKYSRIYGPWAHLPGSALVPGANVVSVSLNANDHSEWSVGGVPITSTVIVYASPPKPADKRPLGVLAAP